MLKNIFTEFVLKLFLSIKENKSRELGKPVNILLIFQHYTSGFLLTQIPLIKALKNKYPQSKITAIVSSSESIGLLEDKLISNYFVFEKRKLFNFSYILSLKKKLKQEFDLAIVPTTLSISLTSLLLMRFSNSITRVGPESLNGINNKYKFLFDRRINLDLNKMPDSHISDFALDILRPFQIDINDFSTKIFINKEDKYEAEKYLDKFRRKIIIGINLEADILQNQWPLIKFAKLMEMLDKKYLCSIYITNLKKENKKYEFIKNKLNFKFKHYKYNSVGELAEVISKSSLFITNADDIMYIAGATPVPQITLFGLKNPFNFSPIGKEKYFIRKSDLISDITVDDVFNKCKMILDK